jgi:hypothetical protein
LFGQISNFGEENGVGEFSDWRLGVFIDVWVFDLLRQEANGIRTHLELLFLQGVWDAAHS